MTEQIPVVARATRRFAASAERVYDAWLTPDIARRWFFSIPTGEVVRCEIDARVGGRFVVTDRRGDLDVVHEGAYLELERPRLIVFRYAAGGGDPSVVRVDIRPLTEGCEVTVAHELAPGWASFIDSAASAWAMMLDRAEGALAG